jgi:hypothetical protein
VTLALEGLFGELRLADFDELDLSNMNRIRCAVHDIGVNKAVICARQIFEQNPYAKVAVFTDGFTRENLTPFFDEGGRLNIVIDECDSLWAKLRIREEARARKIPVLMETSDRGLLDIERYDLEPDRPVLHGLLGGLTSEDVDKMPPPMRVGLVLRVVGQDTMSPRAAASMLELGRSVRAFSQLGSDVTLGGATTSIAVRRLGLDLPMNSGRVYIDVSKALADAKPPPLPRDVGDRALDREHAFIREVVGAASWPRRWATPSRGSSTTSAERCRSTRRRAATPTGGGRPPVGVGGDRLRPREHAVDGERPRSRDGDRAVRPVQAARPGRVAEVLAVESEPAGERPAARADLSPGHQPQDGTGGPT